LQGFERAAIDLRHLNRAGIFDRRQRNLKRKDMVYFKAAIGAQHAVEGSGQQASRDDQHERERDLSNQEEIAKLRRKVAAGDAESGLERIGEILAGGSEGWS
jgi:hypothetical protein